MHLDVPMEGDQPCADSHATRPRVCPFHSIESLQSGSLPVGCDVVDQNVQPHGLLSNIEREPVFAWHALNSDTRRFL